MKAIILGGYHNGTEIETELDWVEMLGESEQITYYVGQIPSDTALPRHRYKRVQLDYIKDYRRYEQPYGKGYAETYLKMEDVGLFVPVDTPESYLKVLRQVFKSSLSVNFERHTNVL